MNLERKFNFEHRASMRKMGAACVVSAGFGMTTGTAATMTVNPIVLDWDKYPEWVETLSVPWENLALPAIG